MPANNTTRPTGGAPTVSKGMNAEGRVWARMTADNIGKCIAVVLMWMVYSYPIVSTEITGGRLEITGDFTSDEADDLVNVLKSGNFRLQQALYRKGSKSFLIPFHQFPVYDVL